MHEFKFACPVCRQHIQSDPSASGTQIECPTCFQKIVVPQAPAGDAAKFIIAGTQAPAKRPLTELASASEPVARPPRWLPWFWAGLAVAVLAGAAVVLAKSGLLRPRPQQAKGARTNVVARPFLAPTNLPPDPRWRLELAEVVVPTNPANGRILGREFTLRHASIQNGSLSLWQGAKWPPEVGVGVLLPKRPSQEYAGKHFLIPTNFTGKAPRVILRTKDDQQQAVAVNVDTGYALRLEFEPVADGHLPGRVYLCTPDEAKSVVVGRFRAEIRVPPPPKPRPPKSPARQTP